MNHPTALDASRLVTELRVHLGAHKTASTHLQDSIKNAMSEVTCLGVNYVPRGVLRQPALWWRLKKKPGDEDNSAVHLGPALAVVRKTLLECVSVKGPVAVSEENLLGTTRSIIEDEFYPDLSRLKLLTQLWPDRPLHLFLCIRSLDGLLPSAYCQALRRGPFAREDLHKAQRRYLPRPTPWFDLVTRIRTIAPEASLEVWLYDEYRQHWLEMHRSFLGLPNIRISGVIDPLSTRRLSEAMVEEAERLPTDLKDDARAEVVDRIFKRHVELPSKVQPFNPFSEHDAAMFRDQFQRDLSAIKAYFPEVLRSYRDTPLDSGRPASAMRLKASGNLEKAPLGNETDCTPQLGPNGRKLRTAFVALGHKLFPQLASQITKACTDLAGRFSRFN